MKNLNKVRTVHPVGRIVEFNNFDELYKFVLLYGDLFYKAQDREKTFYIVHDINGNYETKIYFTIEKKYWDEIQKNLKLEKVKNSYRGRFYKYV